MNTTEIIKLCNDRIESLSEAKGLIESTRHATVGKSVFEVKIIQAMEKNIDFELKTYREIRSLCY